MDDTTFDVARARRETPGCTQVTHFNNAGSSLAPTCVVDAIRTHLDLEARLGGYEAQEAAQALLDDTYQALSELIGCERDEIALVENATRAWDMAFYAMRFAPGDRILTGRAEYASNVIAFLQRAKETGVRIEVIPDDERGQLDVSALRAMLDERVKLIAVTHVPTNGGLVNPAAEIGHTAREAGAPFLLDACQSIGQMPVDVRLIGCDMLSATGRKFLRGPRGTGFLYVRRAWIERLEPPLLDLHAARWTAPDRYEIRADARRFESWEGYVAGRIGLGVATRYALGWGLQPIQRRIQLLATELRGRLEQSPDIRVCDKGSTRCGIVSFMVDGEEPAAVKQRLRRHGINVSQSDASSTLYDMAARGLTSVVRASVHYYNTIEEIERLAEVLKQRE